MCSLAEHLFDQPNLWIDNEKLFESLIKWFGSNPWLTSNPFQRDGNTYNHIMLEKLRRVSEGWQGIWKAEFPFVESVFNFRFLIGFHGLDDHNYGRPLYRKMGRYFRQMLSLGL